MPTLMCTSRRQCRVHEQTIAAAAANAAARSATDTTDKLETSVSLSVDRRQVGKEGYESCCIPVKEEILDFVVIGNGPSGICLSYMLSGNWPYYTWNSDEEMLHARLMEEPDASLVQQDLEFLSDGMEGRSNNPVSILLDTLQRPKADLGLDLESNVTWRLNEDKALKHVVLGQGGPGGVWQTLDGNLKTVSLGAWMQLPSLSMPEWEQHSTDLAENVDQAIYGYDSTLIRRTRVSSVAEYYTDYVKIKGLEKNFRNYTVVTKVRRLNPSEMCKLTLKNCDKNKTSPGDIMKNSNTTKDNDYSTTNNDLADSINEETAESRVNIIATASKLSDIPEDIYNDERISGDSRTMTDYKVNDELESSYEDDGNKISRRDSGDKEEEEDDKIIICCECDDCTSLEPGACPLDNTWEHEELFTMEDDDLSSVCSSLTQHSFSPVRETRESGTGCQRSASCSSCACMVQDSGYDTSTSSREQNIVPAGYASMNIPIPTNEEMVCPSWDPIINPYLFSFPTESSMATSASLGGRSFQRRSSLQASGRSYAHRSSYQQPANSYSDNLRCESVSPLPTLFEVTGYEISPCDKTQTTPFKYLTQNVVLATGLNKPNKLEVQGEDLNFVFHKLSDLEAAVGNGGITPNSDPIMIIGAGLTAADAIISAQAYNIPVVHVFRRSVKDPQLILNKLPMNLYPEYENVRNMMAGGQIGSTRQVRGGEHVELEHPKYRAFAETSVKIISKDREVTLTGPADEQTIKVSCVLVLIGASLQLDFLEPEAQNLGRIPTEPVNKSNPVDIDVFTHQSVNVPGLFALGPLVGDNFVRFLQGGALAITSFAHKQKLQQTQNKQIM